jgi:hypothetical protein
MGSIRLSLLRERAFEIGMQARGDRLRIGSCSFSIQTGWHKTAGISLPFLALPSTLIVDRAVKCEKPIPTQLFKQ